MRFLRPEFAPWWQLLPILLAACIIRYLYLRRQRRLTPVTERFRPLSRRSTWAREAGVTVAVNVEPQRGMLSSILAGFEALRLDWHAARTRALLV